MRLSRLLTAKRLALWGGGLLFLSWLIYVHTIVMAPGLIDRVGRFKGSDYVQFYVMGSLLLDGRADALYDPAAHLAEARRRIRADVTLHAAHPNYGPQVALAFAPLALLPFGWSLALFLGLTAVAYGVSVWIICRECPGLLRHPWLVALLAAASPLFLSLLRYGQASAFMLLIWALALPALRRAHPFTAGLVIGCLAYKPQLGIVAAVVLLAAREWRIVGGAVVTGVGQLGVAWLATDSATMEQYFRGLWTLMLNPGLVQLYPSEIHSLRGFLQLLIPSETVVAACSLAGLAVALALAKGSWSGPAPIRERWGQIVLLTVLTSPHLITYDLVLLTLPLCVFAEWALENPGHRLQPAVSLLLVLVYFAPFSGQIIARLTWVQVSVVVFAVLAWHMHSIGGASRPRALGGAED